MARLLLVEDDLEMAETLTDVFQSEGHSVRHVRDGEAGLVALDLERPEIIVSDVDLPVLDGLSMAHRILLRDAGLEKIPIILISGVPDLHAVARRIGTPYFLAKPVTLRLLHAIVQRALSERQAPAPPVTPPQELHA